MHKLSNACLQFGKKGDAKLIRKPGGGIEIDSTYFDVEALKIGEMDLGDFIGNILKKGKFAQVYQRPSAQVDHAYIT